MNDPEWLNKEFVLDAHEFIINETGGSHGVRDEALLESALSRAQNAYYYEQAGVFDLAAAYAEGISRNHPFIDGNKRTAFVAADIFLKKNGYELQVEKDNEQEVIFLSLAEGKLSRGELAEWYRQNTQEILQEVKKEVEKVQAQALSEKPHFQANGLSDCPTSAQERHQWATDSVAKDDPQAMRDALAVEAKQFGIEQATLHDAVAHAKDASEQKRLELRAAIEQAKYEAVTKKAEAKLHGREQGFDSKDSLRASREAKDAEKRYEADKQEWHKRSVRDDAYKPFDAELAKKAQVVREQESASWAKLAARSKREGWDQQREQAQQEALQRKLDIQLDQSFSKQHGYGHDR